MSQLTAVEKVRLALAGDPEGDPVFPHEGEPVVRWLTGGTLPDAWVTFHPSGDRVIVRCAGCRAVLGDLPAGYERTESAAEIGRIRQAGHEHHKPAGWPRVSST